MTNTSRYVRTALICVAILMSIVQRAQAEWRSSSSDNGAYFYGYVLSDPSGLSLECIGPSRGGIPPEQVEAHETSPTQPYAFGIVLGTQFLPAPATPGGQRSDVAVWLDGRGYQLPTMWFNELDGYWGVEVPMTDALITAMKSARELIVGPMHGTKYRLDTGGLGAAIDTTMGFCMAEFARQGLTPPPGLQVVAPTVTPEVSGPLGLRASAVGEIGTACGGPYTAGPGHLLTGNINGDEVEDVVVDWSRITCNIGDPRPYCGASMCTVSIYLSNLSRPNPEQLLALGVSLIPLSNGLQGVQLGGSLSSCREAGRGMNGCHFIWYWSGADLQLLP